MVSHYISSNFIFFLIPIIRKQDLVTQIISIMRGPRDSATVTVVFVVCHRLLGWLGGAAKRGEKEEKGAHPTHYRY